MMANEPEYSSNQCQRLQCEWGDTGFSQLADVYSHRCTGPLHCATVSIAGSSIDVLVDPGLSCHSRGWNYA